MWAYRMTAPRRFERCEVESPDAGALAPGEVLLRTTAGGICGSDMPYVAGRISEEYTPADPRWPGEPGRPMHEVAGTVVASRSEGLLQGDQVVGWASSANAIAEYVVTDGSGLCPYDPQLPAETAVSMQPLACVLYVLERLGPLQGSSVAVLGLGAIGMLFAHTVHDAGAAQVIGIDPIDRRGLADRYGLDDVVVAPSDRWLASLDGDARPDVVIEAVGHQAGTLSDAVEAVAPGGRVFYFGIPDDFSYPLNLNRFLRKDLTLQAGLTRDRRRMLAAAGRYLDEHPELAKSYVTEVFPVSRIEEAFASYAEPAPDRLKVIVTMTEG